MRAICDDVACLQCMLDFEAGAGARRSGARRRSRRAPPDPIAQRLQGRVDSISPRWREAATRSGNLAIPLVKALTAKVAKTDAEAARYVHWGATSQDVIDTATMLGLRAAIDALLADLDRAIAGFATLARQHRDTAVVGAHLAAARVADAVRAQARRICRGAASLAHAAAAVARRDGWRCNSAARPARSPPLATRDCRSRSSWRRNSSCRCRMRPGTPIATASRRPPRCWRFSPAPAARSPATCQLMMQTDVAEAFEPSGEGRGGSSTMPHKRNPVAAATALGRSHHGAESGGDDLCGPGAGPRAQRRALACGMADLADAAARHLGRAGGDLSISPKGWKSMLRGCASISTPPDGLIMAEAVTMALAEKIGKSDAHHLIEAASKKAVARQADICATCCSAMPKITAQLGADRIDKTVRADGLSGRFAGPDRPPARFDR